MLHKFERPPDKEKAAHSEYTGTARKNKLHNINNEKEAMRQGLVNLKMFSDAVLCNLMARYLHKYLNDGHNV